MTSRAFTDYIRHIGDRTGLFLAVAAHTGARRGIYPGSYLDFTPSYALPDVTYLDSDPRARKAFADPATTLELAGLHRHYHQIPEITFVPGDYTHTLRELPAAEWDLAISLYAGPVSEHVARCLKSGGWLLANNSHADAGLAHINPDYRLAAAIHHRAGRYRLTTDGLERYLLPKTPPHPTRKQLQATGRGIAYTRPATAYLFQHVPHGQQRGDRGLDKGRSPGP
ncbi:hypothetical protein ACGFMM_31575 [Streptomyces sp. NPDC048604]|uniref:hypothetical protein n=1 Tax=Streptomyces sp. NPDC048604 TaxID=3365578 RepID=UPI0037183DC2